MTWAERLRFAPAPPTGMVVLRVLLYGALAVWALALDAAEVAETAALHWEPRSVFVLLPGPPSESVVLAAQGVLALAAVAAALGWHGRVAQVVAVPPFVLLAGLLDAVLGTLAHRTALVVILAVALAPAPLWAHASLDRRRALRRGGTPPAEVSARWAWPVGLAQLVVVLVYFSAGLAKLTSGGLAWLEPASFQRWTWVKLDRVDDPSPVGMLIAESPLLAFASAAGILAFQLSIVLVLVFPRFRSLAIAGIVSFHVVSWLALDLQFLLMAAVAWVPLVDWHGLRRRVGSRSGGSPLRSEDPPPGSVRLDPAGVSGTARSPAR